MFRIGKGREGVRESASPREPAPAAARSPYGKSQPVPSPLEAIEGVVVRMDFFEQFSGLAELHSPEARRRRLLVAAVALVLILAAIVLLDRLA